MPDPVATSTKCWICGAADLTGEHKIKRTDLCSLRAPTSAAPLYYHDLKARNKHIYSLRAEKLKFKSICFHCNNARTQPYDRAWEQMSAWLRTRPDLMPNTAVRANRIFPYDTRKQMLDVHLYFVKIFGCLLVEGDVSSIEVRSFATAIQFRKAHPKVYLVFGKGRFSNRREAGRSSLEIENLSDGSCAFAVCIYDAGDFAVNVMFAEDGERRQSLVNAWHPRLPTRFVFASLD